MVKATVRTVHHEFSKYLDMAHEGEEIVITKRGKPWARLRPIPATEESRTVLWPDIEKRAREISRGKKVEAVKAILKMREEERS